MLTVSLTLPTPDFGDAGFALTLNEGGEVTAVRSATAELPEMVFRLTYGDRWEDARAYFQDLGHNLRFRAGVAVWLTDPPREFRTLRRAFRSAYPAARPPELTDAEDHRRHAAWWLAHPSLLPALFVQQRADRTFRQLHLLLRKKPAPAAGFTNWLFSLLPLRTETDARRQLYTALALVGSPLTTDYLFGELERAGRHPYAAALLGGMTSLVTDANRDRILGLYDWIAAEELLMPDYLRLLHRLPGPDTHGVILRILEDYPAVAAEVLTALRSTRYGEPEKAIRARFDRPVNPLLLDQLAELTAAAADPAVRVGLADMNARMDREPVVSASPVTWPQLLWTHWATLLEAAPAAEVLDVVGRYLPRREPYLQRNALLQLRLWVSRQRLPPALPPPVEERLRELIHSRIDKISTVAVDLLGMTMHQLADPEAAVDALLRHSLVSRYRLMDFAALKKAATRPGLRERQLNFFRDRLGSARDQEELKRLKRTLPYLSYLGAKEELLRLWQRRAGEVTAAG